MKIIGETKEGFILEASKDEVANLKGFYSDYQLKGDNNISKLGEKIEVEKIYSKYKAFERIITTDDFKNALNRLKDTVEVLTPVQELFNQTKEIIK